MMQILKPVQLRDRLKAQGEDLFKVQDEGVLNLSSSYLVYHRTSDDASQGNEGL